MAKRLTFSLKSGKKINQGPTWSSFHSTLENVMMPAFAVEHCVRAVLKDAMFTIFQPRKGGRRKMLIGVYRQPNPKGPVVLPEDQYSDARIWNTVKKHRMELSPLQAHHAYWRFINMESYRELLSPENPENADLRAATWQKFHHAAKYGEEAHRRILTDVDLWRVEREMCTLLRQIGRIRKDDTPIRRIIASNQEEAALRHLLQEREVVNLDGKPDLVDSIHTSEALGTNKPFPEFWERILEHEKLQPHEVIHVGNSPVSDVGACELGIHVILYDRERELTGIIRGDFSEVAMPAEHRTKLSRYIHEGLVNVVHSVSELRELLLSRLAVERNA